MPARRVAVLILAALTGAPAPAPAQGQSASFQPNLDLLHEANVRIDGAATGESAGTVVSRAGDVNGDGIADVIVGAPDADSNARSDAGSTYVVFGRDAEASVDLASLGNSGFAIDGAAPGDRAGQSVDGAGDVNGDGKDDLVVAAPLADNNDRLDSGSAYVIYGQGAGTTVHLASLGDRGFRIDGAVSDDLTGSFASGAGDVNGDGAGDVIVGAPGADNNDRPMSGSAYVVYGNGSGTGVDLASLGTRGFRIDGAAGVDGAGNAVSSAGDVNGDGTDDVIVGALRADNNRRPNSGSAYVVYGQASNTTLDLGQLGARGFRMDGATAGEAAGSAVAGAGDVNDDGTDDIIVGAPGGGPGSAYVVYGQTSNPTLDLAVLGANSRGLAISGAAAGDRVGHSVSGAGDINGDGVDDVIVGGPGADNNRRPGSGSAYVVYGGGPPEQVFVNGLTDFGLGFRIDGAATGDEAGRSVSEAGDITQDGDADVVVGAPGADNNGRQGSGSAYVIFSRARPCNDSGAISDGSPGDSDPDTGEIAGGPGDDFIRGSSRGELIQGGDGNDLLCGQGGNDTLLDGRGEDRAFGEDGADVVGAGVGTDTYSGGQGRDRVSYSVRTNPVFVSTGSSGRGGETTERDVIDDFEDVTGGKSNDEILGNLEANTLTGGPGEDLIFGSDGDDRVRGGEGNDASLEGGHGNDTLEGNGGSDALIDGEGADLLLGGDGDSDQHTLSLDGSRDYANCGTGTNDRAVAQETADRASRNCESRE